MYASDVAASDGTLYDVSDMSLRGFKTVIGAHAS